MGSSARRQLCSSVGYVLWTVVSLLHKPGISREIASIVVSATTSNPRTVKTPIPPTTRATGPRLSRPMCVAIDQSPPPPTLVTLPALTCTQDSPEGFVQVGGRGRITISQPCDQLPTLECPNAKPQQYGVDYPEQQPDQQHQHDAKI